MGRLGDKFHPFTQVLYQTIFRSTIYPPFCQSKEINSLQVLETRYYRRLLLFECDKREHISFLHCEKKIFSCWATEWKVHWMFCDDDIDQRSKWANHGLCRLRSWSNSFRLRRKSRVIFRSDLIPLVASPRFAHSPAKPLHWVRSLLREIKAN